MTLNFLSQTFTRNIPDEETLRGIVHDSNVISRIPPEKHPKILEYAKALIVARTSRDELEILNEMAKDGVVPNLQSAYSTYRFFFFFFRTYNSEYSKNDNPEDVAKDLVTLGTDVESQNRIQILLELVKNESTWYEDYIRSKSTEEGLVPNLIGVATTAELRGVFNREIEANESPEDFAKELSLVNNESLIPLITVKLSLSSGQPRKIVFQDSPVSIKWLIERLEASLKKSEILENRLKTNK